MSTVPFSVLVCMRSRLIGEAVAQLLTREPDLTAEARTASAVSASTVTDAQPSAIVVDGPAAESMGAGSTGGTPVVVLGSRREDAGQLPKAVFLPIDAAGPDLVACLRSLRSGEVEPTPPTPRAPSRGRRSGDAPQWLTEREQTVVGLLAAGRSAEEMARQLEVSVHTVRTHVQNVLGKLDAHSRTDAVARARELGLVNGHEPTKDR